MQTHHKLNSRYILLDYIRGLAVWLMIIFHFGYDLSFFGFAKLDFSSHDSFWYILPRIIVFLFLIAVGISLVIVHSPEIKWKKFNQRFLLLFLCALGISLVTYFLFPTRWVYFGTLHCIALCCLLAIPFISRPIISLLTGVALLIPALFFNKTIPWIVLNHQSMDYIPPFPWFGVVLLGIFAAHKNAHQYMTQPLRLLRPVAFMGRHSLLVYLLHQPLIFGALWLFNQLLNWFA